LKWTNVTFFYLFLRLEGLTIFNNIISYETSVNINVSNKQ